MRNTPNTLSSRRKKSKLGFLFLTIRFSIGRVSEYIDHVSTNESVSIEPNGI